MTFAEGYIEDPQPVWPEPGASPPEPEAAPFTVPEGKFACGELTEEGHACLEYFDTPNKAGVHRWNAHKIRSKKGKRAQEAAGGPSADRSPPSVTINLGGGSSGGKKGDAADLAQVEKRAQELVTTAAGLALLVGMREDAADLQRGSADWAKAVRDLAEYEEWLIKLATGGEATGRAFAWLNLLLATGALAMPSLLRHGVLPEGMAEYARNAFAVAQTIGAEGEPGAQAV